MRGLALLLAAALAPPAARGDWNAASVWGIQPNASYHPGMANVLFEGDLATGSELIFIGPLYIS